MEHGFCGIGAALDCNSLAELRGIDSRNLVKAAVKINGPSGHNFFLPTPDDSVFFLNSIRKGEPTKLGSIAGTLPMPQSITEREEGRLLHNPSWPWPRLRLEASLRPLLLHDKSEANECGGGIHT